MGGFLDDWFGFESGGDSDAPTPPDPAQTASAQYQYNKSAGIDQAFLNAIDQYGPYGSTVWARRADGTPYAQAINLSPEVQAYLDSQFAASTALTDAAQKQLGFLPQDRFQLPGSPDYRDIAGRDFGEGALDYSSFADPLSGSLYDASAVGLGETPGTQSIADTFYEQAKSRFEPDLAERHEQKQIELAQRGIPIGSEIYEDEMNRLDRSANALYSDAARQAELAAGQEQSRQFGQNLSTAQYGGQEQGRLQSSDLSNRSFLGTQQNQQYNRLAQALGYGSGQYQTNLSNELLERNQPFAEAAALLGTSPSFQTPSFQGVPQTSIAPPDYTGVVNNNYATQAALYGNQQAANASQQSSLLGTIGQIGAAAAPFIFSDEDMKEDRSSADGEDILDAFRDMSIDDWNYTDQAQMDYGVPGGQLTGPMAQDWAEEFGTSDGKTIPTVDILGKLMAAMKALDRRTMRYA